VLGGAPPGAHRRPRDQHRRECDLPGGGANCPASPRSPVPAAPRAGRGLKQTARERSPRSLAFAPTHRSTRRLEVGFRLSLLLARPGLVALGFLDADQAVAVRVDLAEQLFAEQELLARDVAVAVAVHLAEPQRATHRWLRLGLPGAGQVALEEGGAGV